MAYGKWIGAVLGFINGGVLGALAGFALGYVYDRMISSDGAYDRTFDDGGGRTEWRDGAADVGGRRAAGERGGFLFSLMVLSAHIIQADGKIMHSEMELLRRFLRQSFGEVAVEEGEQVILRLFEYRKQRGEYAWRSEMAEACREMQMGMAEEHREQLMAFLCEIAKADGRLDESEQTALREVAVNLGLDADIVGQLLSLGSDTLDDAYAVLGLSADATDDEVRKAYRRMALKHHPDRVATLGDDVKAAATRKFQEINAAKERIFAARGMR